MKQENAKLKEENDTLKKNADFLEKFFKNIKSSSSQKLTSVEFAGIMSKREAELSEAKRVMSINVNRIRTFFDNLNGDYTNYFNDKANNYIDNKTLEDKLLYYSDKLFKYIEVL